MKCIDLTVLNFSKFIPEYVLETEQESSEIGQWVAINSERTNFLKEIWGDRIHTITKLPENMVLVIFDRVYEDEFYNVYHTQALFKGILT